MVSLISLFSFKWMQHSSLTISTVVLHCCMGLNICPLQPQKWPCSSGGWFLSIQGSSEAWKSLSIRHDILSAAAGPRGSPSSNILGTRAGGRGSPGPLGAGKGDGERRLCGPGCWGSSRQASAGMVWPLPGWWAPTIQASPGVLCPPLGMVGVPELSRERAARPPCVSPRCIFFPQHCAGD